MIIPIDQPDDPRIEAYRSLRERDLVGRRGRFIAEGEIVLRTLVTSPQVRPLSLLIAERRLDKQAHIVDRAGEQTPVYVAPQAVLDQIVGFSLHRGLLGLGERIEAPSVVELLARAPQQALVVALFGIGNHDNMGGIFRNAAAFGAHAVLLDPGCCDPLYRKAIRVSAGAALRVPFARWAAAADAIGDLEAAGFSVLALSPAGALELGALSPPLRSAVLLGSEGPGLAPTLMARARTVSIPMSGGFDSLNVATTSGIVLHHLTRT